MDFGSEKINAAWAAKDPNALVGALEDAGWIPVSKRPAAGTASIRVLRGRDVIADRYPVNAPYALLVVTRATFRDNMGGDSIRDGSGGCSVSTPPLRVVFEMELTQEEIDEVGL